MRTTTNQFTKRNITRAEAHAYEMWIAVWSNRSRGHVMLGAPTLDLLAERWEQLTHSDFDRTIAQRVVVAAWVKEDLGGEEDPTNDKAPDRRPSEMSE